MMSKEELTIRFKRSKTGNKPSNNMLGEGVIGLGIKRGNEALYFENENGEVITLTDEVAIVDSSDDLTTLPKGVQIVIVKDEGNDGTALQVYSKQQVDDLFIKKSELDDTEQVISASLNDLNSRIIDLNKKIADLESKLSKI